MPFNEDQNQALRKLAEELVQQIETGDQEKIRIAVADIVKLEESVLYQEIGKLTRGIHSAISEFQIDSRISTLADHEFPDARARLQHVVELTRESADQTLTAVEQVTPIIDTLKKDSVRLQEQWTDIMNKNVTADQFRNFSNDFSHYLSGIDGAVDNIRMQINEILLAQGFQDLTGQIIQRVTTLVKDVEDNLVGIIRLAKGNDFESERGNRVKSSVNDLEGPQIRGRETDTALSGQDEVDDLLSSLGF